MSVLIYGADLIVEESERIALHYRINEFIIGATLVALGTSLPEMAASISASLNDKSEIAVANVIGSNILNIALVLATVFIISKSFVTKRDFFAKDSSWLLFPALVFILMVLDGHISRFDGILLLVLMLAYILFLLDNADDAEALEIEDEIKKEPFNWKSTLPFLLLGFLFVIFGADYAISSASSIAQSFGVSEWIIGIVMISLGTSLPELVVSISAALKGKVEMSIGNIIGSNMANTTIVLGAAALASPINFELSHYLFDITTMLALTLMLIFITVNRLYNKSAGIALLVVLGLFLQNIVATI
jgi:cation:H+ antiporter